VIIVWALILGAIIWAISVGQFSGFFSGIQFDETHLVGKALRVILYFTPGGELGPQG
jgi:hypothetical protein